MNSIICVGVTLLISIAYAQEEERIPVVENWKPLKYLGQWYQTHASAVIYATFEANSTCNTATYGVYSPEYISVYNTQNDWYPGGPFDDITGSASLPNGTEKGILAVDFPSEGEDGPPAPYWIMELGPENYGPDNLYAYSLVSEPSRLSLFVLARDIDEFYELYYEGAMQNLTSWGFNTTLNPIIESLHTEECVYPTVPQIINTDDFDLY